MIEINNIIKLIFVLLIVYLIYHNKQKIVENFTTTKTDAIKVLINEIYKADIEAIRNLSSYATYLMNGATTTDVKAPGNLTATTNIEAPTINATRVMTAPTINTITSMTAPSITATNTIAGAYVNASTWMQAPNIEASNSIQIGNTVLNEQQLKDLFAGKFANIEITGGSMIIGPKKIRTNELGWNFEDKAESNTKIVFIAQKNSEHVYIKLQNDYDNTEKHVQITDGWDNLRRDGKSDTLSDKSNSWL